jgi:hypothetical protein
MHPDPHIRRQHRNRFVDRVDIEIDEFVGILTDRLHFIADRGVAEHRDRDLVELHIFAACFGKVGDLLLKHLAKIAEEGLRIGIDLGGGEIAAAIKMHR